MAHADFSVHITAPARPNDVLTLRVNRIVSGVDRQPSIHLLLTDGNKALTGSFNLDHLRQAFDDCTKHLQDK